jgi:alpha-beta hydrolase superfamily lysophospholipase
MLFALRSRICSVLFATLCALPLLSGCDTSGLRSWHTEILEGEYAADTTGDVDSLEEYLQLEDAVFAEMEERIYAHTGTGPDAALERYSRGSLADPEQRQPNWNRSFVLGGDAGLNAGGDSGRAGVLLLHGMSDSPYSLRALGETLHKRGYTVVGLRMPGHGTLPSGLLEVQWQDMAAVVRLGMQYLARQVPGKPLYIVGYSTGAPLALDYVLDDVLDHAAQQTSQQNPALPPVAKLVLVSPAISVSPAAALAKWSRRISKLPGLDRLAWLNIDPEFDPYKYNSFATNAAEQVHRLTQSVATRLANRADADRPLPPMLIFKSTVDATVSNDAVVDRLLLQLSPQRHELVVFDINRFAANTSLLINDPGPFTARLIADQQLPFTLTLVTNANAGTRTATAHTKPPFAAGASHTVDLGQDWPVDVFSLSHVALPFPPDDPLYGQRRPEGSRQIFLGQQALQGERGVLKISGDFLLRLRHNPFYAYQQARILQWLE